MSDITILVVDDSATIRRLVDATLSPEGYRVVLASGADDGLEQARALKPDLILLDHQLPGTTGYEVCRRLQDIPEVSKTPIVISSTLRKKAYVAYTDVPNVVDLLPKPYSEELLKTTVSNALDTGRLIVQSQADGTTVPEVIHALEEADMAGIFKSFSLRELLDFLNNGTKSGVLEVQAGPSRIWYYVDDGRLQAVIGTGIDPREIVATLPDSLRDLAPVLNLTVGGKLCSEVDGLVELLDRKVLDPRLLRQVLRHQAAMLVWKCFHTELKGFRFESGRVASPLFRKLPLDTSLAALLVEAALCCDEHQLSEDAPNTVYVRRTVRGQNLDRAGLTVEQMKVLSSVNEPVTAVELADRLDRDVDEIRRILHGLTLAELLDRQVSGEVLQVIALESDPNAARNLRTALAQQGGRFSTKIVRDQLAVQLLLKRTRPNILVLPFDSDSDRQFAENVREQISSHDREVKLVGTYLAEESADGAEFSLRGCDAALSRPFTSDQVIEAVGHALNGSALANGAATAHDSPTVHGSATADPAAANSEASYASYVS